MLNQLVKNKNRLLRHTLLLGVPSLILILIGFFWLDQPMAQFFKRPELEFFYRFNREITNIGYSIHYFVLALVLYVTSHFFSKKISWLKNNQNLQIQFKEWSKFIVINLVLIGLFLQILKMLVGRQRPHMTEDFQNLIFSPFATHWHWHSFPSGHTQVIFTMATIACLVWPRKKILILLLAVFLGFTRVVTYQHFFSDFVAGAYLGYILTLWIYSKWPPKNLS